MRIVASFLTAICLMKHKQYGNLQYGFQNMDDDVFTVQES